MTKEVKDGDVDSGEFLNTLTGESYGNKVNFVVAFYQKGRAASSRDGRYFVAIGTDVIPEAWADHPDVGEEFVGTPFSEFPDAEERYKERVNAGEIEWGKGPLVSTTYNYTGLVLPTSIDGEDVEVEPMPVRQSFLRTTKKAHDKLVMLKRSTMRNKSWWDAVFTFTTKEQTFGRNTAYVVEAKKARDTSAEEKALAVELASAVMQGRVGDNAESTADAPASEPQRKGGLAV